MAATSHTTLPSSSYAGLGSQGDLLHSANYGTYDTGVGSTESHPYHNQTTNYENHHTDSQLLSSSSNNYTHSQTQRYNNDKSYAAATSNTTQATRETTVDIIRGESNNQQQTSHADTTQRNPPVPRDNQNRQSQAPSQPNRIRSEHNISNQQPPAKQQQYQPQPAIQSNNVRSEQQNSKQAPLNGGNNQPSSTTTKTKNPPTETKTTKSNQMRAAAIKQKEDNLEQKRKDGNFPSLKKKSTPPKPQQISLSDDEQIDKRISKQNKKQLHPISKQHQSRYDGYQTEDNNSSADEDTYNQQPRHKSKKSGAFSDSNYQKYPPLPPVRAGRGPPFYDPAVDYPYFLRGRYPFYYDLPIYPYPYRHRHHRHLYVDGYDAPPYVTSHHDSYDGFFDYQKRKSKSKTKNYKDKKESSTDREDHDGITGNETEYEDNIRTRKNKNQKIYDENDNEDDPPFYHDGEMLETWRQERNDYLKKQFKPTIHDVLYSQQWMKTDSYVENQRRRALRDSQGYYFPYKKYTLKDYKDLQKNDLQQNPYSSIEETSLDRKERVRKRQEYASHLQTIDISGGQSKTSPREIPPRKPWHLSSGEPKDPEKPSKRERALEYAKVQVIKHRAQNAPKNPSAESDPTEQYVNSLFPHINDDEQSSENDDQ